VETIEVLVTTMGQADFRLYETMNLQTDALFANQADRASDEERVIAGRRARMISTKTRGLAINRNLALMHAQGDILLFADDDQAFAEGYEETVLHAFAAHPKADAIKFYCASENEARALPNVSSFQRATLRNTMAGGVHALAVRRSVIYRYGLLFPIGVGAGQFYDSGEDSLFLKALIDRRIGFFVSPEQIATVSQRESTWFQGYTEHFFITTGYIYAQLYGAAAGLAILRRAWRVRGLAENRFGFWEAVRLMRRGEREFLRRPRAEEP